MTSPELSHLQLLTLVGELGSIGRAAEKLGISQPAASKRMDQLERRLGLRLLDRNSRGSALTAEGKAVCQWAEKVVASFDALLVGASALRADLDNDLRVASSMTLAEQFVPLTDTEGRLLRIAVQSYRSTPTREPVIPRP